LNKHGEMIGITTAIVGRSGQSSGIGLAIPANTARRVVDELVRFGRVIRPDSGIATVYETERGLVIARLTPEGPAERAGLRGPQKVSIRRGALIFRGEDRSKADVIIAVDGKRVRTLDDMLTEVEKKKPGDKVTFTILREGERMEVDVELEASKG
jgi:S1-C subfamily serine protease